MKQVKSLLITAVLLVMVSCGGGDGELTVFAAASMQEALTEIGEAYMAERQDIRLVFHFDSSGTLQTQIEEGAVCDVFISAGQQQMERLDEQGMLLGGSGVNLLENQVVLATEAGAQSVNSFDALKCALEEGTVLLAMGNSGVPAGQYAQKILEYLGLDEAALATSGQISYGSNVKEVSTQISEGVVDCGIIYATDAKAAGLEIVDSAGEEMCGHVIYPASILEASTHRDEAMDFLSYLRSEAGRARLEAYGFAPFGDAPLA